MPVINGTNADESNLFAYYMARGIKDNQSLDKMLAMRYGAETASQISSTYKAKDFATPAQRYGNIMTNSMFSCPIARINQSLEKYVPLYAYELTDQNAPIILHTNEMITHFRA